MNQLPKIIPTIKAISLECLSLVGRTGKELVGQNKCRIGPSSLTWSISRSGLSGKE